MFFWRAELPTIHTCIAGGFNVWPLKVKHNKIICNRMQIIYNFWYFLQRYIYKFLAYLLFNTLVIIGVTEIPCTNDNVASSRDQYLPF